MSEPQPIRTAEVDTGVDLRSDLSPTSPTDRKRMEELMARRADASELKNKNILKGDPNDRLAGKRADLEKDMLGKRLDKELAARPDASELVKKGILNADEVPPHDAKK